MSLFRCLRARQADRRVVMVLLFFSVITVYESLRHTLGTMKASNEVPSAVSPSEFYSANGSPKDALQLPLSDNQHKANVKEDLPNGRDSPKLGDFDRVIDYLNTSMEKCNSATRPKNPRPLLYDTWHVTRTASHEIFTFSAFYDDRPETGLLPKIRILAVARTIHNQTFCQVWYPQMSRPYITEAVVSKSGGGHRLNKTHYEQYYFSCSIETTYPIPTHVSLVMDPCVIADNYIPLYIPLRSPPEHEFGVCVPVAFQHVDPYLIVEWVEIHRLLGVTEINVYHVNMSNETLHVLRHYEKEGIMRLVPIPSAPQYEKNRSGNKIGSPISLNDCMYRNIYRYKWVVAVDFDEVIMPQKDMTYTDMIKRVNKEQKLEKPPPAYTFRNTYFWTGCGTEAATPEHTHFQRFLLREEPSGFLYASKSMIDPKRCISVFNHYCYVRFPNKNKKDPWTIDVNSNIAISHHYRKQYKKESCDGLKSKGKKDENILRFKVKLNENFHKQIQLLKL